MQSSTAHKPVFAVFLLFLLVILSVVPALAVQSDENNPPAEGDQLPIEAQETPPIGDSDELPVVELLEEEEPGAGYLYKALLAPAANKGTLKYAPYIGSGYFVCLSSSGTNYIYVPIDTKGKWGTTNNGYLCNVSSNAISGIMFDSNGTQYYFNAPSFSVPRIRLASSSSYNYTDYFGKVQESNLNPATEFPVEHPFSEMYVYILIGFMGVITLCLMRFKR